MTSQHHIPQFVYKLMLLATAMIWGLSFVIMKDAVDVMTPAWLIGVRFSLTGIMLALVFAKRLRGTLNRAFLTAAVANGVINFLAYWVQTIGLTDTTPGKNAFLTAIYCVIVPFMMWAVARKRPSAAQIAAAFLCLGGVGLVSMTDFSLTMRFGDFMTVVSAVFFAAQIVCVAHYSQRFDVLALTVYQFLVGGVCGIAVGSATEPPPNLAGVNGDFLFNMFYLVVISAGLAYVLQNTAISKVPPSQASLLLCLESVFGVMASVLLYGEALSLRLVAGFAVIFAGILLSELGPLVFARKRRSGQETSFDPDDELEAAS